MATQNKTDRWLADAEEDFFAQLKGLKKNDKIQDLSRDFFLANQPEEKNLIANCSWLSRHMFIAGLNCAIEQDWPVDKIAKQVGQGLMKAQGEIKLQFLAAACIVTRAAVQAALMSKTDVGKMTESVVGAIMKAGRKAGENQQELSKKVSRTAVETASSFPKEDKSALKKMLMDLLDGKLRIDD